MKQESRLQLLTNAINRWLELPRTSRATICTEIVQAVDDLGLNDVLGADGITFNKTDDVYNDARVNAQKIFRWLGQYEGQHAFTDRLFCIEQAILYAMPRDIALQYLHDVYGMCGVYIGVNVPHGAIGADAIAAAITKENAEAQISVIQLGDRPSEIAIRNAYRELKESVGTTLAALDALEIKYPLLKLKTQKAS